jgi:BAI1-associated protein 3
LQRTKDALIHFVVKDHDLIGTNEMVGEAFFAFSDIRYDSDLMSVPQFHLPMTRASSTLGKQATTFERTYNKQCLKFVDSEAFKALEHRQGDKMARDFIKKERARMPRPN